MLLGTFTCLLTHYKLAVRSAPTPLFESPTSSPPIAAPSLRPSITSPSQPRKATAACLSRSEPRPLTRILQPRLNLISHDVDTASRHVEYDRKREATLNAVLEDRKPLRKEIHKLVAIHRDDKPPPFSNPELMVMAIIDSDEEFCGREEIVKWILENFAYHKNAVCDSFLERMYSWGDDPYHLHDCMASINNNLERAFSAYGSPVVGERYASVEVKQARFFLQRWLEPERKGTFRILDLPPELRDRIFDLILVFPSPALKVRYNRYEYTLGLEAHGRAFGPMQTEHCALLRCSSRPCGGYNTVDDPKAIMNLAITCKQLAAETIPIFYGRNRFSLVDADSIVKFTKIVSPRRMRHLKKLHILLEVNSTPYKREGERMKSAIALLGEYADSLDKLTITVGDYLSQYGFYARRSSQPIALETMIDTLYLRAIAHLASKAKKLDVLAEDGCGEDAFQMVKEYLVKEVERFKVPVT